MATDTEALLRALLRAQVEFVIVGGTAAIVHGAATPTDDLDIVVPMTEVNYRVVELELRAIRERLAKTH